MSEVNISIQLIPSNGLIRFSKCGTLSGFVKTATNFQ